MVAEGCEQGMRDREVLVRAEEKVALKAPSHLSLSHSCAASENVSGWDASKP